jgi:mRNA interferase RelE/StbE
VTAYHVLLQPRARKEFLDLPANIARRVHNAIQSLQTEPRARQSIKLSGGEGYRLRIGDYRILYDIDDSEKTVTVYRIKHRREAYR